MSGAIMAVSWKILRQVKILREKERNITTFQIIFLKSTEFINIIFFKIILYLIFLRKHSYYLYLSIYCKI